MNPKNKGFSNFLGFLAAEKWIATKRVETDQDNLRTGTAIGSRASHEHQLRYFVKADEKEVCNVSFW